MYMSLLRLPGAVVDPCRDLASSCGVPDAVAEVLQQAGWNVTLFSCWVASAAEVSTEVAKLGLPADLEDTPLLIASLRALWKACLAASETKGPLPTGATTSASVSSSWADNFPPRMPADELHHRLAQATAGTVHNAQKGPEAQRKELAMGCKKGGSCEA